MADHRKRFERWRSKLSTNAAYLVDRVLAQVVPEFEAKGFAWYPDYAGGDSRLIGANELPLQRRSGRDWPTVQIAFDKRGGPNFHLDFAALPALCKRWKDGAYVDIPREQAIVVEAPVSFALCKGRKRNLDCQFGYSWFAMSPRKYLDSEVATLRALLPELFDLFARGIPESWGRQGYGYVAKHILARPQQS